MNLNFENNQMVTQPENLSITLFPHQLNSIYRLEELELNKNIKYENYSKETKIGILSDNTGSGKSLTMIGLIIRDKIEWDLTKYYTINCTQTYANDKIKMIKSKQYDKIKSTLILVSEIVIRQWEKELSYTKLKYKSILQETDLDINVDEYDIILVIPKLYNLIVIQNNYIAWKRFIYDEPSSINVPNMKEVISGFYWFITSNPTSLKKNYGRNHSFMKEIFGDYYNFEHIYNDLIIKNDEKNIKQSLNIPITIYKEYICYQPIYNVVKGFVSADIIEMISADNIEGVINILGGKMTDNIIELINKKQHEDIEHTNKCISIYENKNDEENIKKWKTNKEKIELQINELNNRFKNLLEEDCIICYDKIKNPVLESTCHNVFCAECLLIWLKQHKACPLCRNEVDVSKLIYIKTKNEEKKENEIIQPIKNKLPTKLESVIQIIIDRKKEDINCKFIIFSNHEYTFKPIYSLLKSNNISYSLLRGTTENKYKQIDEYKIGKTDVLFLNSIVNNIGINLQETTDIIIYHEITNIETNQLIGKVNRIGKKNQLNIHTLKINQI
jgi:hypothetical protein